MTQFHVSQRLISHCRDLLGGSRAISKQDGHQHHDNLTSQKMSLIM